MTTTDGKWEAGAHFSIGRSLMRKGDYVTAQQYFAKALARTPDSREAMHNLGVALLRAQSYKPAIYYFEEVIRLDEIAVDDPLKLAATYNLVLALRYQAA